MVRARFPIDPLALMSLRAIRETEIFLEEALLHEEMAIRIPVIRVGSGSFSPKLSAEFWSAVLDLDL